MNSGNSGIDDFIRRLDEAYTLKARRLNFMNLASVSRQILHLRDGFDTLWEVDGSGYRLSDPDISGREMEILTGIFAEPEKAQVILDSCREILDLDRVRFDQYLAEKLANAAAVRNLYGIFYGEGMSIEELVREQVPYLKKYIPTFRAVSGQEPRSLRLRREDIDTIWDIIQLFDRIKQNIAADIALYKKFRKDFRQLYREAAALSILGYGEISTVMQLAKGRRINRDFEMERIESTRWVWKRLPPMTSIDDVKEYERAYREYREILVNEVGLLVPVQALRYFDSGGKFTVYAGQERINPDFVCHKLLKRLDPENAKALFARVLGELRKLNAFNTGNRYIRIGLDGQLSNWVLMSAEGSLQSIGERDELLYIDTSTPLYRKNGVEQINAEIFIRNTPSFLRGIIRAFFLHEVLDRYYDLRSVIIDLIANLHKEKMPELIDHFILMANEFLSRERVAAAGISRNDVDKYYEGDAFIWKFFQFSRRVDKFIIENIFRKKYSYRLPEKIER